MCCSAELNAALSLITTWNQGNENIKPLIKKISIQQFGRWRGVQLPKLMCSVHIHRSRGACALNSINMAWLGLTMLPCLPYRVTTVCTAVLMYLNICLIWGRSSPANVIFVDLISNQGNCLFSKWKRMLIASKYNQLHLFKNKFKIIS